MESANIGNEVARRERAEFQEENGNATSTCVAERNRVEDEVKNQRALAMQQASNEIAEKRLLQPIFDEIALNLGLYTPSDGWSAKAAQKKATHVTMIQWDRLVHYGRCIHCRCINNWITLNHPYCIPCYRRIVVDEERRTAEKTRVAASRPEEKRDLDAIDKLIDSAEQILEILKEKKAALEKRRADHEGREMPMEVAPPPAADDMEHNPSPAKRAKLDTDS
jgi:hypothetical protein